jgi:hypothetical protein
MKNKLIVIFKAISISVVRIITRLIFGTPENNLQDRTIRLLVVTLASFAFFPIIIISPPFPDESAYAYSGNN